MRLKPNQWAPNFDVRDIHNKRLTLQQFGGHHLLLSFNKWTTCPFSSLRMLRLTKRPDGTSTEETFDNFSFVPMVEGRNS